MSHIAIQEAQDGTVVGWLEHVPDDQYFGRKGGNRGGALDRPSALGDELLNRAAAANLPRGSDLRLGLYRRLIVLAVLGLGVSRRGQCADGDGAGETRKPLPGRNRANRSCRRQRSSSRLTRTY